MLRCHVNVAFALNLVLLFCFCFGGPYFIPAWLFTTFTHAEIFGHNDTCPEWERGKDFGAMCYRMIGNLCLGIVPDTITTGKGWVRRRMLFRLDSIAVNMMSFRERTCRPDVDDFAPALGHGCDWLPGLFFSKKKNQVIL